MSLSTPRQIFGVHSITPYSRATGEAYGIVRVAKDSSISLSGEQIENTGGSNKYPWAIEDGKITAEMTIKMAEYPNFVFELFLGKAVTSNAAETSGNVSTAANKYGTSLISATTGVASVVVIPSTGAADLKFGKYVLKVASSTTVDIFLLSDVDVVRGTDVEYVDDTLKIIASAQTITTGGNTDVASLGLRLTGGSGTIGMTVGDTATFEVRPINSGSITARIGASTDVAPEFGCIVIAQKRSSDEFFEIDAFRCKSNGLPIGFAEKAFSEVEAKAKLLFDAAKNGVFDIRGVTV